MPEQNQVIIVVPLLVTFRFRLLLFFLLRLLRLLRLLLIFILVRLGRVRGADVFAPGVIGASSVS